MNKKQRLEKLNKILNERRQNLEQGSQENSNARNSDSKNSKFEKLTDDSTINLINLNKIRVALVIIIKSL